LQATALESVKETNEIPSTQDAPPLQQQEAITISYASYIRRRRNAKKSKSRVPKDKRHRKHAVCWNF
jgi:hypothetical protein